MKHTNEDDANRIQSDINDILKQIEERDKDKLSYINISLSKKENETIQTVKIRGENKVYIDTGIAGEETNELIKEFDNENDRRLFIDDFIKTLVKDGYEKNIQSKIFFIQVQYSDQDNSKTLSDYDNFSEIFDKTIINSNLGSFAARDLGSGYNYLYDVWDIDLALIHTLIALKENNIANKVVIAKRINVSEKNWDYEVIHPKNFKGEFNSM